jgi:TolA-binding protein
MDEIRDTRPWFWILIGAVAAVAVVGLVIAISANNSSIDEKKVVNDATAEIKAELAGLNGALKAADEFQEETQKLAAQDRKRIKKAVNSAVAAGEKRLDKLDARVASLEGELAESQSQDAKLTKSVENLEVGEENLEAEIAELEKEVDKLKRETGGREPPIGSRGLAPQKTTVPSMPRMWTATMLKTIDFAVAVPTPTGPPLAV